MKPPRRTKIWLSALIFYPGLSAIQFCRLAVSATLGFGRYVTLEPSILHTRVSDALPCTDPSPCQLSPSVGCVSLIFVFAVISRFCFAHTTLQDFGCGLEVLQLIDVTKERLPDSYSACRKSTHTWACEVRHWPV